MRNPYTRKMWAPRGAAVGALLLLVASALGAHALSHLPGPVVQSIVVGGLPDALALDPRSDRAVVADDADATVSILDLATGRNVRTVAVGPPGTLAPLALAADTRTHCLFVANRGDNGAPSVVRVLDSRDGAVRATVRVRPEVSALAVDARAGHLVVASEDTGTVSLLAARTGRLLHTTRVGLAPLALAVDPGTARAFVLGTVVLPLADQSVGGQAGLVGVLDTRTGVLVRTVVVGYGVGALAVDVPTARVFVANSDDDTVSMLDARTGVVLRTVRVGWAPAALAVDARDGRVFVVNEDAGTLSVLDARTGGVLRTVAVFDGATASAVTLPYALAVDEARHRVYMTAWGRLDQTGLPTGSGQLAVLDARFGRRLRTLPLGMAPQAVAVQEDSGRVVVVDNGGMLQAAPGGVEQWMRHVVGRLPWLGHLVQPPPATYQVPGSVRVIAPGGR